MGGAAAGSGRRQRISPPLPLLFLSAWGCRGCARLPVAAWAGRLPGRDQHAPLLVLLCGLGVSVGRHAALLGGDAEHVGTDTTARPSNHDRAETLKARGTVRVLGRRHPSTSRRTTVVAWGGEDPLVIRRHAAASCLACWACPASADIPPAWSLPYPRCAHWQGMSWRLPATPLLCRGNQAVAAGPETRRRSVNGRVSLRNSPSPGESPSHLSGPPSANRGERGSGAPRMAVAPRGGRGGASK